jgi:hypothetical protein
MSRKRDPRQPGVETTVTNNPELIELDRQVERGNLFAHTALSESYTRLGEAQAFIHGLADVLLDKGVVGEDELREAIGNVRSALRERGDLSGPGVMVRVDGEPAGRPAVEVDCAARMPVCQAACCKLDFALTIEEIEAGQVKWDLGRPYFIRHGPTGGCAHNDPETGGCGVYANRPGVCRGYSCADDPRIWKDFEGWELNTEWIDANLSADHGVRAVSVAMHDVVPSTSVKAIRP